MDDRMTPTAGSDAGSVNSGRQNISADEEHYLNNHPQFMDTIPQDAEGKNFIKQFAALSEGLIPVDGNDGTASEPQYDVLADHLNSEEAARKERLQMQVEKKRAEMKHLFRMPSIVAAPLHKRKQREYSDDSEDDMIRSESVRSGMNHIDDATSSYSSVCRSDDNISVHSEAPALGVQRKRARLRSFLQKNTSSVPVLHSQPVMELNVSAEHSDSDSSDAVHRFASVEVSEVSAQRMVCLPQRQVCTSLPPDEYTQTQTQTLSDLEDQDLQRAARDRVEMAETKTTLRFLKM